MIAGRVGGEAIAPGARGVVRWLVDESEGNGALAVRIAITGTKPPAEGDRIAVAGAWTLDDQRRWYWQVASLSPLDEPLRAVPLGEQRCSARRHLRASPCGIFFRPRRSCTVMVGCAVSISFLRWIVHARP